MRLRLLLLVTGAGALLTGLPCSALTSPAPSEGVQAGPTSGAALALLHSAAVAARSRTWSGTQHVVSVRDGQPTFSVLRITHRPGDGSVVQVLAGRGGAGEGTAVADVLDSRLLALLAAHYDLSVRGTTRCAGHEAVLVEAHRPGLRGATALAGRFWVDRDTHLVLRREVMDTAGAVVRSSSLVDVSLTAAPTTPGAVPVRATGTRLDRGALGSLEQEGWPVLEQLPGGLELLEARLHDSDGAEVLQLSYSDGLSTLSLFAQEGELGRTPPGTAHRMDHGTVWVDAGSPERVVWSSAGRTWTLVSDAPTSTVVDTVSALPHEAAAVTADGTASRLWRGMSRVGGWLNPFD